MGPNFEKRTTNHRFSCVFLHFISLLCRLKNREEWENDSHLCRCDAADHHSKINFLQKRNASLAIGLIEQQLIRLKFELSCSQRPWTKKKKKKIFPEVVENHVNVVTECIEKMWRRLIDGKEWVVSHWMSISFSWWQNESIHAGTLVQLCSFAHRLHWYLVYLMSRDEANCYCLLS